MSKNVATISMHEEYEEEEYILKYDYNYYIDHKPLSLELYNSTQEY